MLSITRSIKECSSNEPVFIESKQLARALLKRKGSKVAVQICFDGPFVYAEKTDFVREYLTRSEDEVFTDYDGEPNAVKWHDNILYIFAGTL